MVLKINIIAFLISITLVINKFLIILLNFIILLYIIEYQLIELVFYDTNL